MEFSERLDAFGEEIFASLNEKRLALEAEGRTIYNLSVGTPDFPPAQHIVDALVDAAREPSMWKYSLRDLPELKQAVCDYYERRFGVAGITPDMVTSVNGTQEGVGLFALAMLDEGDTVLVPNPSYPIHIYGAVIAGADVRSVKMIPGVDFLSELERAIVETVPRPKMMILGFPSNPTAQCADLDFFAKVIALGRRYGIWVVHDLAYADICYDGYKAPSIMQVPGAKDVAVELHSLSKSHNMTGWRVGFVCGNAQAVKALGTIKNNIDSGTFKAIQEAAIEAYNAPSEQIEKLNQMYKERKEVMEEGLRDLGWSVAPSKATFYLWLPVPEGFTSEEFVTVMLEKAHVVVPPGNGYGKCGEGFFRIALTRPVDELREALRRMKRAGISYKMTK